ncbi:MAG: MFS transporter [Burkholderiales bacterium]|nr:MFS transporter [Burkholderiales bacterium]
MTPSTTPSVSKSPIGPGERLGYGMGDLASNLVFATITNFLMFFYTDIFGLAAAAVGTMLFFVRAWDAVFDVFLGAAIDRTRTRWGQARPYLLFTPLLLWLAAVATFSAPALDAGSKLVYAYVTYGLLMMAYSLVNIPYIAMLGLMTGDPETRTRITGIRMICAFSGALVVGWVTLPLVHLLGQGDMRRGFQFTVALLAAAGVLLFWTCFAACRERIERHADERSDLLGDLRAMASSRGWWVLIGIGIAQWLSALIPFSSAIYYFKYVVGDASLATAFFVLGSFGMITGAFVSGRLTARWCKRSVWLTALCVTSLFALAFYATNPANVVLVMSVWFAMKVSTAIGAPIMWSMVPDIADEVELRTGRRVVGLATSAVAFSHKVGMGFAAAVSGLLLAGIGYQPGIEQSAATQHGLRAMMGLVPAAGYLVVLALLAAYPLNRSRLVQQRDALAAARSAAARA